MFWNKNKENYQIIRKDGKFLVCKNNKPLVVKTNIGKPIALIYTNEYAAKDYLDSINKNIQ